MRPEIDLSSLIKFSANELFQMENLSCLKMLLLPGDFMTNIDLKDAYLSAPVHETSESSFAHLEGNMLPVSKLFVRPPEILRKF